MVYHLFPFGHLGSFVFDPHECPHIPIPKLEKIVPMVPKGSHHVWEFWKKPKNKKGGLGWTPLAPLLRTFVEASEPLREPKPWRFKEELQVPDNCKKTHHSPPPLVFFFLLFFFYSLPLCCNRALLAY
jgi:hypothetical protein